MDRFVHLHIASGHSVRYGAAMPARLVARAAERGMDSLALTERDTVTSVVDFALACAEHRLRPIFGVDLAIAPLSPDPPEARSAPVRGGAFVQEPRHRATLLADGKAGWARLCRLVSAAHEHEGAPVLSWAALREHAGEGLIALLGPASEPVRALTTGRGRAENLLEPWRELFGTGLRLEAVGYPGVRAGAGSLGFAARTLDLGNRLRVPVVLTNAVRYADADQHRLADVLDAARLLRPIAPRPYAPAPYLTPAHTPRYCSRPPTTFTQASACNAPESARSPYALRA